MHFCLSVISHVIELTEKRLLLDDLVTPSVVMPIWVEPLSYPGINEIRRPKGENL